MSKYLSTDLALAIAQLEAKARARGERIDEPEAQRRRGWEKAEFYDPEDVGSAISNTVRASRRLAGKRK